MCGATFSRNSERSFSCGLSPRVRGNRQLFPVTGFHVRSIPACAGQPHETPRPRWHVKVYPRVCGATYIARRVAALFGGLSPRVRGNPTSGQSNDAPVGSIPACAGQPYLRQGSPTGGQVYPRVCGATPCLVGALNTLSGLSPRVRGNPLPMSETRLRPGSIPACAGQPESAALAGALSEVYPRVCGATTGAL